MSSQIDENSYRFTVQSEINDLKKLPCLKEAASYTFGNGEKTVFIEHMTFESMQKGHPTWDAAAAVDGANRLLEIARSGQKFLYSVYSEDEIRISPEKKDVRLLYYPAGQEQCECQADSKTGKEVRPWVILAAGGGYFGVCSLVESMPTAAYLNKLGYDVFCLNYRAGKWNLMPRPIEDLAASVAYIRKHAGEWNLTPDTYICGGFSAGGHMAGMWGTERHGYMQYHQPAPQAIWLNYPMVSADIGERAGWLQAFIVRKLMFGLWQGKRRTEEWALDRQITENYPPTFLAMAKDDDTIPQKRYEELLQTLTDKKINTEVMYVPTGGHGYGLGRGTDCDGWVDRAIGFTKAAAPF